MSIWVPLTCPTCGARLRIASGASEFTCEHCGNSYLLEQKAGEISRGDREYLLPRSTTTRNLQQWLKAGEYEIEVHELFEEKIQAQRVFYANVEYRNNGTGSLSCRRNQWVLYDSENYTYDAATEIRYFSDKGLISLGSERFITTGMSVRGWLAFPVLSSAPLERLQFITGFLKTKTIEFMLNK